jgi:alpha-L-fucosidase
VVNDRWGSTTHQDYGTSEYEAHKDAESFDAWENCRGIGFSFGYNQVEGPEQTLTGKQLARQLVDVVSRGGRFLLNVGPKADGTIPAIQRQSLTGLGAWMSAGKQLLVGATPLDPALAMPADEPWVRWIDRGTDVVAFVDSLDESTMATVLAPAWSRLQDATVEGGGATITHEGGKLHVQLSADRVGPAVIRIPRA